MADLIRMSIPRGWAVLDNKFYDVDSQMTDDSDFIINWYEGFIEDVLWIQETQLTEKGKFVIPETNHFNLDIGWYPDSRIDGEYCATLSWCSTQELIGLETFRSKNRFEIRDKIEFWMGDINENRRLYLNKIPGT